MTGKRPRWLIYICVCAPPLESVPFPLLVSCGPHLERKWETLGYMILHNAVFRCSMFWTPPLLSLKLLLFKFEIHVQALFCYCVEHGPSQMQSFYRWLLSIILPTALPHVGHVLYTILFPTPCRSIHFALSHCLSQAWIKYPLSRGLSPSS